MRPTGTLNTDWPFSNTKEPVLTFLGVIMVLWLCYRMNTCTYLCKNKSSCLVFLTFFTLILYVYVYIFCVFVFSH